MLAMSEKIAVITGASSGFGLLTAVELAVAGYRVVATMRNLERRHLLDDALRQKNASAKVDILELDITYIATIPGVVE